MKKLKKYFKNKMKVDDFNIKWKVSPSWKKNECKATISINKSIDNVDFYAVVDGNPFLIAENGIGINTDPEAVSSLSAQFKATLKF